MRKYYQYTLSILSAIYLSILTVNAQQPTCTEVLNQAQTSYDEGRIYDITEETWGTCLNGSQLNDEQRVQAFRLMTLVYLQTDDLAKADEYMFKLLDANPEYAIDEAVDPTEFINLYKTIRTDPIMRVGVRGGGNYSMLFALESENNYGNQEKKPRSVLSFGFQVGASVEIDLFDKLVILNPEVYYTSMTLDTRFNNDLINQGNNLASLGALSLNVVGHYSFFEVGPFQFLASLGVGGNYILNKTALLNAETLRIDGADSGNESPQLDYNSNFIDYNGYVTAGGGVRFKIGRPYITADFRYQYGFINVASANQYGDIESTIQYAGMTYITPSTLQNVIFNAGIHFPIFKHEKLTIE